ncbi:MAG TPA: transposase [Nitrospiraceae bacterium]|nr:transposase [Nitrospiraceae bacterium]
MGNWTIMGTAEEREAFWRSHHEAWQRSNLNQHEYEAHGLVLKRFENWRAKFRDEPEVPQKLLYRRGGRPSHMTGHMTVPMTKERPGSMALLAAGAAGRRRFSEEDKRRIVDEASQPGCSVSQTARRYGIAVRVLFRWKEAMKPEPIFAPVQVTDAAPVAESPATPSIPGIEVELVGRRRVRFERDADPETVRRLVRLLEGGSQ